MTETTTESPQQNQSHKMPAGIPYILANEAAERFSFYGMTAILVVFMTQFLLSRDGNLAVMGDETAKEWFHWFNSAVYFLAVLGALISDIWLGKYRTILWFSILYCLGFLILTVDQTRLGLFGGLTLIAIGSGAIKPCVTANVGDQFNRSNQHLIEKVYSWFYFAINLGACVSMYYCPLLLDTYGPKVGFGIPAVLMLMATVTFWLGKQTYVHIPPTGRQVLKDLFNLETLGILGRLSIILVFVSMFFALFYQSQGAWVLQAEKMELRWLGRTWLPAQVQFVNSLFIMILIPVFSYVVYPVINRVFPLTPLRKIGLGLYVTAASFLVPIWIENQIAAGLTQHRLAIPRLSLFDRRRNFDLHHRVGILLHTGPQTHQILCHGVVFVVDFSGQHLFGAC